MVVCCKDGAKKKFAYDDAGIKSRKKNDIIYHIKANFTPNIAARRSTAVMGFRKTYEITKKQIIIKYKNGLGLLKNWFILIYNYIIKL